MNQDLFFLISVLVVVAGFIFIYVFDQSDDFNRYFKNPDLLKYMPERVTEQAQFLLPKYQQIKQIGIAIAVFGILLILVNIFNPSFKNKYLNYLSVLCLFIVVILSLAVFILCTRIGTRNLETDLDGGTTPVFKLTTVIYIPLIFSILGLLLVFKLITQISNVRTGSK